MVGRVTEREGEARQWLGWPEPEDLSGSQKPPVRGCCWDQQGRRQERWDDVPPRKETQRLPLLGTLVYKGKQAALEEVRAVPGKW